MAGHTGHVDEVRLAGEVESDLQEQVGWNTVKRILQGIDAAMQHRERRTYVILQSLHLKVRVRAGRNASDGDATGDEPLKEAGHG